MGVGSGAGAASHSRIVIEDLYVSGMMKNKRLARVIADVGMYEFRRQLEYKCAWYGSQLVVASRFLPSSKLCSNCGLERERIALSERVYTCEACGIRINRDDAAADILTVTVVRVRGTADRPGSHFDKG